MDRESAAVIQNARDVAVWAASEVAKLDERVDEVGGLAQRTDRALLRELLVRMSQQNTMMEYALEARRPSWRALLRECLRCRAKKIRAG